MMKCVSLLYFIFSLIHTGVMELTRFLEASESGPRAQLMMVLLEAGLNTPQEHDLLLGYRGKTGYMFWSMRG